MKKIFYLIITLVLILTGCSNFKNNEKKYQYDIGIVDKNKILLFEEKNNELNLVDTKERSGKYGFLNYDYIDLDKNLLIKTTVIGKHALLANIDKDTLDINLKNDSSEPYTFTHYKDKIYATDVFTDRFNIYEYDMSFKELRKKEIKRSGINVTNDIIVKDDIIYLLIGNVVEKQNKNILLKLNMDFEVQEEIDLNYENGAYMRMVMDDNYIYLSQNSAGLTESREPRGSNKILKLNLKNNKQEFITLDYNYPLYMHQDEKNLIIEHYNLYVPSHVFTIYNKRSGKKTIINFPNEKPGDGNSPYFAQDKNNFYFLFEKTIYKYNKETFAEQIYDLSKFNVEKANVMIKKDDK
ncbi:MULTISPECIES: membrane lipoprotein lipid attachment site-containing protein [unclassified Gemella]|uniref:membrane lipoprotein lipid attachment site-containing protein n=1 Tax=unclassified Gemella TaxID=2624949 RepID=UPI001C057380|nr:MULTISPECIES: membrane lipoprotein lipid attachment site-containing protein [unclassified Gemella]MBU0278769.1 membrane lipoprotein lipid attachment site-containing protein [Gemella sp. zg-1178]QWQ38709.1 membrane lipoprotein lipid attachment site-containing protein [Gemella sp. zg-570]